MPSLPVSRGRALLLAGGLFLLLVVAGRTLADTGASSAKPADPLVAAPAPVAASRLVVHVTGAVRAGPLPAERGQQGRRRRRPCGRSDGLGRHGRREPRRTARRRDAGPDTESGRRCGGDGGGARRREADRGPREPEHRRRGGARRAAGGRPGYGAEDRRLPLRARRLPLGGRPGCDPRDRPRPDRAAARIWWGRDRPRLADRARRLGLPRARPPNASGCPTRGCWAWRSSGSRSLLPPWLHRARACRRWHWLSPSSAGGGEASGSLHSTRAPWAPPSAAGLRRSRGHRSRPQNADSRSAFRRDVRVFADARIDEPVLLELPVGRSPPQGAVLAMRATV